MLMNRRSTTIDSQRSGDIPGAEVMSSAPAGFPSEGYSPSDFHHDYCQDPVTGVPFGPNVKDTSTPCSQTPSPLLSRYQVPTLTTPILVMPLPSQSPTTGLPDRVLSPSLATARL